MRCSAAPCLTGGAVPFLGCGMMKTIWFAVLMMLSGVAVAVERPLLPERVVVLTFDDSVASHATFVAPMLKEHGFGATFFITEGFELAHSRINSKKDLI